MVMPTQETSTMTDDEILHPLLDAISQHQNRSTLAKLLHGIVRRRDSAEALLREKASGGCEDRVQHPGGCSCRQHTPNKRKWCWSCRVQAHLEESQQ